MHADVGTPLLPDILSLLREETGPAHQRLDASFGSLALKQRDDMARFLSAHAVGIGPIFPAFRRFVEDRLGLECPDYPAMLHADLMALGVDPATLPAVQPAPALSDTTMASAAGIAYVVCGSRLGLVMIRQQGYWGEAEGFRSAYMTDGRGHDAWKALVPTLRTRTYEPEEASATIAAANATFDVFAQAFAAAGIVRQPIHG